MLCLLLLLFAIHVIGLDAAWAPLEWTRTDDAKNKTLCEQWKAQPPSIFSAGSADQNTALLISSSLTGFRMKTIITTRPLNLETGKIIQLIKRNEDDAVWSKLKHSFIAQTGNQSFVATINRKDNIVYLYAFPVDGKRKMWVARTDGDGNAMNNKVLFSVDNVGQFAMLNGTDVLEGNFDPKDLEEKAAIADGTKSVAIKFNITGTILTKIRFSGAIDGGFITSGNLFAIDNVAKKMLIYTKLDPKNIVKPFQQLDFNKFFVCDKAGVGLNWTMILIDATIGLAIVALLTAIVVLYWKKRKPKEGDKKKANWSNGTSTGLYITSTTKQSGSSRALFSKSTQK